MAKKSTVYGTVALNNDRLMPHSPDDHDEDVHDDDDDDEDYDEDVQVDECDDELASHPLCLQYS